MICAPVGKFRSHAGRQAPPLQRARNSPKLDCKKGQLLLGKGLAAAVVGLSRGPLMQGLQQQSTLLTIMETPAGKFSQIEVEGFPECVLGEAERIWWLDISNRDLSRLAPGDFAPSALVGTDLGLELGTEGDQLAVINGELQSNRLVPHRDRNSVRSASRCT